MLVASKKPTRTGSGNIELQVVSTESGLQLAKELGSKYVAKTRTDWRMCRPSALKCLNNLLEGYPPAENSRKENRIVATSIATLKHRIYGLMGIFQFGSIWGHVEVLGEFESCNPKKFKYLDDPQVINGTPLVAEIYLCARYIEAIGIDLDFSLKQWWESSKNNFIVVDNAMLDGFWNKYDMNFENRFTSSYTLRGPLAIDHFDWLRLLSSDVSDWLDNGFQERWDVGEVKGKPFSNGISQISV